MLTSSREATIVAFSLRVSATLPGFCKHNSLTYLRATISVSQESVKYLVSCSVLVYICIFDLELHISTVPKAASLTVSIRIQLLVSIIVVPGCVEASAFHFAYAVVSHNCLIEVEFSAGPALVCVPSYKYNHS